MKTYRLILSILAYLFLISYIYFTGVMIYGFNLMSDKSNMSVEIEKNRTILKTTYNLTTSTPEEIYDKIKEVRNKIIIIQIIKFIIILVIMHYLGLLNPNRPVNLF